MTGSIKDRMALHILRKAYAGGQIHPGETIAEATSGNTGISFAAIGSRARPSRFHLHARLDEPRAQGSHSQLRRRPSSRSPRSKAASSAAFAWQKSLPPVRPGVFLPRQFSNAANVEAHETTTGPEISAQLGSAGLRPDAFVAGVGTGGTVMGAGRFLRCKNPHIRIHPVEPAESPTLSTGCKIGTHRIQGISDEFIPAIMDLSSLDEVIDVSDGDSILMAQKLAAKLGLAVGVSSGCNFLAAVKVQEQLGSDAIVVTVFPDDNKKYLSTDLLREEPCKPGYLTPAIELLGLDTFQRDCTFCKNLD